MVKENNGLIIAVLAFGALFMMAKSGDKATAVVKKKQEKSIADGTPPEVAVADDPLPKKNPERNRLFKEINGALDEYMNISRWIRENQKEVQSTGLPQQIWGRLIKLRTILIELGMRGAHHFSQQVPTGIDAEFWRIWRGIWTGIQFIGERQRERWITDPPSQFAHPTHMDDTVDGEDDPQDGFDTLPTLTDAERARLPENMPQAEYRIFIQKNFHVYHDNRVDIINTFNRNNTAIFGVPSGPVMTNRREHSAFVTGNPLPSPEEADAEITNDTLGGANKTKLIAPARPERRSRSRSPERDPNARERVRDPLPDSDSPEAEIDLSADPSPPPSPPPPPALKVKVSFHHGEAMKAISAPPTNEDKPPAEEPPRAGPMPASATIVVNTNPSIQAAFNQSGTTTNVNVPQTVLQTIEEQRVQGDPTARNQTAVSVREQMSKAAINHEFRNNINKMRNELAQLIRQQPSVKTKPYAQTIYEALLHAVPRGTKDRDRFRRAWKPPRRAQDRYDPKAKAIILADKNYNVWKNAMKGVHESFMKWHGTAETKEKRVQKQIKPSRSGQERDRPRKRGKSARKPSGSRSGGSRSGRQPSPG